jgi:hypothetical protein
MLRGLKKTGYYIILFFRMSELKMEISESGTQRRFMLGIVEGSVIHAVSMNVDMSALVDVNGSTSFGKGCLASTLLAVLMSHVTYPKFE